MAHSSSRFQQRLLSLEQVPYGPYRTQKRCSAITKRSPPAYGANAALSKSFSSQ